MEEYYNSLCPYVCLSQARGFNSKIPVPTCTIFCSNETDDDLRGTYEKCYDVAFSGRCLNEEVQKKLRN